MNTRRGQVAAPTRAKAPRAAKKKKKKDPSQLPKKEIAKRRDAKTERAKRREAKKERAMRRDATEGEEVRRAAKLKQRHRMNPDDQRLVGRDMWALPVPAGLVGRLPQIKTKHQSYFEFAENTEKQDKRLEFEITNDPTPSAGFKFVPIGNPTLTNKCKEISRRDDAMIFIVSGSDSKEESAEISAHMARVGYHFRESIVDEAIEVIGASAVVNKVYNPQDVEPIPKTQDEINRQADAAIRDLFPRIPNTDRVMVLEHAFKKGALFGGKPTVGLQPDIPLARRVQLAVLAHIRHTRTRYDLLLRETSWINARRVVEPICLDFIVKWRGDEETGRDQLEEILREVIVLTDSEDEDGSAEDSDESSDDEGGIASISTASISQPSPRNGLRPTQPQIAAPPKVAAVSGVTKVEVKRAQRGFKRYQAAWDHALTRQRDNPRIPEAAQNSTTFDGQYYTRRPLSDMASQQGAHHRNAALSAPYSTVQNRPRYADEPQVSSRQDTYFSHQQRPPQTTNFIPDEVMLRSAHERPNYQTMPRHGSPSYTMRDQAQPLLMREAPVARNMQDLLVPSIETASSDAATDRARQGRRYEIVESPQESQPRRINQPIVDPRPRSPEGRRVIIIDDESPPALKRRRVVYEDDAGHFRPHPSRVPNSSYAAARADFHLLPASSVQHRDFLLPQERLPSQSSQQRVHGHLPSARRADGERLPVYEASGLPPSRDMRYNEEVGTSSVGDSASQGHMALQDSYLTHVRENSRRFTANSTLREDGRNRPIDIHPEFPFRGPAQRPLPTFVPPNRESRTDDMARTQGHQAFVKEAHTDRQHTPERRSGGTIQVVYKPPQEDRQSVSFMTLRPGEAGVPVRYVQRPLREEHHPVYYGASHPDSDQRQAAHRPQEMRQFRRPSGEDEEARIPRRPIIVLD